jgi:hypothetical protein
VLVMTDEKFRQTLQFVLDTRVQAGAIAGLVLLLLIVPGTALTKQHDVLLLDTGIFFVTARASYTAYAGAIARALLLKPTKATALSLTLPHTYYARMLAADTTLLLCNTTAVLEATAIADDPVYCLAFVPWQLWTVQLILLPFTLGYFIKK